MKSKCFVEDSLNLNEFFEILVIDCAGIREDGLDLFQERRDERGVPNQTKEGPR